MPLRLDIKKQFLQRTDRVKGVDVHPQEPWILVNLYNGNVCIYNHQDQVLAKSFEVTDLPVRAARFVARKQWIVTGADDFHITVYNYNTMDKVKTFEAHMDYIRSLCVHPTLPYLLSASDDMTIKLWDWEKGWQQTQMFEGHSHYVMQVTFNPKDTNTFASASLDRSIKVWSLGVPAPNFTLEGHEKGVNCVDYFSGGDRPYLISGADDKNIKVWDYQTRTCVHTLSGHTHNISTVVYHSELPLIISGSEDGSIKIWHATTYRLEQTLNYGLERVWALSCIKNSNSVAMGFDEGVVLIKIGSDEPVVSMDVTGKIIWAHHNEIQKADIRSLGSELEVGDGERLPLPVRDLGSCDIYPQYLKHNSNGRFVVVCGDGEYIIYTALAWRNKSFGQALEFVWGADNNDYATRESAQYIKIFKNFTEKEKIRVSFFPEKLFGGTLLGVKGNGFIVFYDWNSGKIVRRIDVDVQQVYWNEGGYLVAIVTPASFYILKFNKDLVDDAFAQGMTIDEDGLDTAFDVTNDVGEQVKTGCWIGDSFVYNNSAQRLNYCIGGEVKTLYHLDHNMFILGYLMTQNRIYLMDKEYSVVAFTIQLSVIEYKTLVLREDWESAEQVLQNVPADQLNDIARFLEAKEYPEKALELATDADYKFELAIKLNNFEVANELAAIIDNQARWKQLGELALTLGKFKIAESSFQSAKDYSGLLLMYSSFGLKNKIKKLAASSEEGNKNNVAFLCNFMLHDLDKCIQLLISTGRYPEAAFFARTYHPSKVGQVVQEWKTDLKKINTTAAESIASPEDKKELFEDLDQAIEIEQILKQKYSKFQPASLYPQLSGLSKMDVWELYQNGELNVTNGNAPHLENQAETPDEVNGLAEQLDQELQIQDNNGKEGQQELLQENEKETDHLEQKDDEQLDDNDLEDDLQDDQDYDNGNGEDDDDLLDDENWEEQMGTHQKEKQ